MSRFPRRVVQTFLGAVLCLGCSSEGVPSFEPIGTVEEPLLPRACGTACSTWVYPSAYSNPGTFTKHLIYVPDDEGDRILDFSRVGYRMGTMGGLPSESTCGPNRNESCLPPEGTNAMVNLTTAWPWNSPPTTLEAPANICGSIAGNPTYNHGPKIQELLNAVGQAAPDPATGVRGRVYLPRAHYAIWEQLRVPSGVVLRGVSQNPWVGGNQPATMLHVCNPSLDKAIWVGLTPAENNESRSGNVSIIGDVPVGANAVLVPLSHSFIVGDRVEIARTPCPNQPNDPSAAWYAANCPKLWQWSQDMGMTEAWEASSMTFDRVITHIQPFENKDGTAVGYRLFLDSPLGNALEAKYGPHTISKYTPATGFPKNVGIYKLRGRAHPDTSATCDGFDPAKPPNQTGSFTCPFGEAPVCNQTLDIVVCPGGGAPICRDKNNNPAHMDCGGRAEGLIHIEHADDAWVADVVAERFTVRSVAVTGGAHRVTVDRASYIDPRGPIDGGLRYPVRASGNAILLANLYSIDGRHDWVADNYSSGPRVFVDSVAENTHDDAGAHVRWGVGTLFDNVSTTKADEFVQSSPGQLNANNAGASSGGSQGWKAGSNVAWNTHAEDGYRFYNPPTSQNWLIGATGDRSPASANWFPGTESGESPPYMDVHYQTALTDTPTGPLISQDSSGNSIDQVISRSLYRTSAYLYSQPAGSTSTPVLQNMLGRYRVRTYNVGDPDNFTFETGDNVNDTVYVNPAFKTFIGTGLPVETFDYSDTGSRYIPFSIRYDLANAVAGQWSAESVVHAYLAVRLRRHTWTQDADHFIQIAGAGTSSSQFTGHADATANARKFFWRCSDASTNPPVCSATNPNGMPFIQELAGPAGWGVQNWTEVRIIELPLFHFGGLLNRTVVQGGRRFGEVNVNFAKRTRVDWASLTIVVKRDKLN